VFSGLRPGEKLYEELLADTDTSLPSAHPRLRIAQLQMQVDQAWAQQLLAWLSSTERRVPVEDFRRELRLFVTEYESA
jgi:FlaA1/EpsC-like NDP-sugar epimerase